MLEFKIMEYNDEYEEKWDNLVLNESSNGNFLQTRNFLNYHKKDKFIDCSLMFFKGETLVAVLPACEVDNGKTLISHVGSTFGGIIIKSGFCNTSNYKWIFEEMISYFIGHGYEKVELRMPNWLYKREDRHNELLDYFFQLNGFTMRKEVGFFVDLDTIGNDYEEHFDSLRKRKLKKANKQGLLFKEVTDDDGIKDFYNVLYDNMRKFDTTPLHSYEEMVDFKRRRICNEVYFYGVYHEDKMIAGSMVFNFCNKKVFHTQYLASRQDCLEYCPNEFLYTSLIRQAKQEGYRYLSYGTATLEHGNVYNESLGMYKEGFDTDSYVNTTYIWKLGRK
jgi:hypothetical protein